MSARVYVEGGGDSKELHARCREGVRRLLEKCGFGGRMPRTVACGSRGATFDDFRTAHGHARNKDYVAMLVDSEDRVADINETWAHLKQRDNWDKPAGASDEQVFLMTTCMETWIVSDRKTLQNHYKGLQISAMPPLGDMESRERHAIQDALLHATRKCKNGYRKGERSFEILGKLDPTVLRQHLPSFERLVRILNDKL
ncbi:MAG: DUF4276 family protein [Planctomycetota bacterium]